MSDDLTEYRITFQIRYERDEHPAYAEGRIDWRPHPDGWLTVLAKNEQQARLAATVLLGERSGFGDWAFIYSATEIHQRWDEVFPAGELARITAIREVASL